MIAEICTWLNTLCHAALPSSAVVEFGAAAAERSPVVPSARIEFGAERIKWIASRVTRARDPATTTRRRRVYERQVPVTITIARFAPSEAEQSLETLLLGCAVGLSDDDGNFIRVEPTTAEWLSTTNLARQISEVVLGVTFIGGLYTEMTVPRIAGTVPEPYDQEE